MRHASTLVGAVMIAALAGVLAAGAPAGAHGADAPDGTDYRVRVTTVAPTRPGVTVSVIEAGARLQLVNASERTITVLGYVGEPYLEVRPGGVYENRNSPATYVNRTLAGGVRPPEEADPTRPPSWQRISTEPVARWHDQRTRWRESGLPAQVRADPSREHRIRDWSVPLRDGTTSFEVRGTLDWLPPPDPYNWWALALLGVLALGALGLVPAGTSAGAQTLAGLAVLAGVGGVAAIALAVAWEIDSGAYGPGSLIVGLLTESIWPLLAGVAAVAACGHTLLRRPAAEFTLALVGTCLAIFAGVTNAAIFASSVPAVSWPAHWARWTVLLIVVTGAGAAAAAALRLHAAPTRAASSNVDHGVMVGDKAEI